MIKIGLIGIAAVFLALPLKKEKSEFSLLIVIMAGLLIFFYTLARVQVIADFLSQMMDNLPIEKTYLQALMKMLGITYIAEFVSSLCREAGYGSIAGQMELFAKLTIIALGIPELIYLVEVIEGFL
jgi:stage III sporulation protein AD